VAPSDHAHTFTSASAYLEEVRSCWDRARDRSRSAPDAVQMDCEVAGFAVRLQFADRRLLERLAPAFEHRRSDRGAKPDLTIAVWAGSEDAIPKPPWCRPEPVLRGSLDYYADDDLQMIFRHRNRFAAIDQPAGLAYQWYDELDRISAAEAANPLRYLFHWWMRRRGLVLCHAAAVGTHEGAALICGVSGSGKSTTTLACLRGGLAYVGDDLVLVQRSPEPRICNVYGSAKLNEDVLPLFPEWVAHVENPVRASGEKATVFVNQRLPRQIASSLPLTAIVLPRFSGARHSTIERASPAATLRRLAPSSLLQLCGDGPELLRELAQLTQVVPGYALSLGTDLDGVADAVRSVAAGRPHA
jgi:hypothetical protein